MEMMGIRASAPPPSHHPGLHWHLQHQAEHPELLWLCKIPWQHPHSHQTLKSLLHTSNEARQHMGLVCVLRLHTSVCACSTAPPEHIELITPVGQPGPTSTQRMCLVVPALGKPTCCSTQAVSMQKSQTMSNIHISPRQKFIDGKENPTNHHGNLQESRTHKSATKKGGLLRNQFNASKTSSAPLCVLLFLWKRHVLLHLKLLGNRIK